MDAIKIVENIYRISANIESADLFEGIWPITDGVSLNSYLVTGDKIALIDLMKDWDGAPVKMKDQLDSINIAISDIDYLIINHMEPDHTGWMKEFIRMNPGLKIYATKKAVLLFREFYGIESNLHSIESGETWILVKTSCYSLKRLPMYIGRKP